MSTCSDIYYKEYIYIYIWILSCLLNELDSDIVVTKFEPMLCYCDHIRSITYGKLWIPLYPKQCIKLYIFYKDDFGIVLCLGKEKIHSEIELIIY